MPSGVEVAQAYITIIPSMKGIQGEIAKQLNADVVGNDAGKKLGEGMSKGVSKSSEALMKSFDSVSDRIAYKTKTGIGVAFENVAKGARSRMEGVASAIGTKFASVPDTGDVPLVADMSSCILSEPVDVTKFGVIYAGAQKNMAPAGVTVVIVREDLLDYCDPKAPTMLEWKTMADNDSMYNTPPCYTIYMLGLVCEYLLEQGGLEAMKEKNVKKAALLYDYLDNQDYYIAPVKAGSRSMMNVTFVTGNPDLDKKFASEAAKAGMKNLKGHRSVGGMRASIYNAMPYEGVEKLDMYLQKLDTVIAQMEESLEALTNAAEQDEKLNRLFGIIGEVTTRIDWDYILQDYEVEIETLKTSIAELKLTREEVVLLYDELLQLEKGTAQLLEGAEKLYDGTAELKEGTMQLSDGTASLYEGLVELEDGTSELIDGTVSLLDGSIALADGLVELKNGSAELCDGAITLEDGIITLEDGLIQMQSGTMEFRNKTANLDRKLIDELRAGVDELFGNGDEIESFVSDKNENVQAVQFVIRTPSIEIPDDAELDGNTEKKLSFWQKLLSLFGIEWE